MTQQRLWFAFAIVAGISFAIQVSWPTDLSDKPETSYDTAPRGHAAVLALLEGFDATRGRWLSGLSMPSIDETVWWIAPRGACATGTNEDGADRDEVEPPGHGGVFRFTIRPWIEAGGTAVVWLSPPPPPPVDSEAALVDAAEPDDKKPLRESWKDGLGRAREAIREGEPQACSELAGISLPPRQLAGLEGGRPPIEGRFSPVAFSIGRAVEDPEDFDYDATRILPGPTLAFFDPDASDAGLGWRPVWVESDDRRPFALERALGQGRLVVVADARVVSNGRLGVVDSAPFVFDWVREHGPPWIDEHAHGVVPESGTFRYLATSPAWAPGLGMLILGLLVVWRGHAWPTRAVSEVDPNAPTLSAFVDSVARLYAGSRDHARVFERYRAVCLERIRRAIGLAPGTSAEIILASLRTRARGWPELRDAGLGPLLTRPVPIAGADDLARNAARLDDLVGVLRRGRSGSAKTDFLAPPRSAQTKGKP